LRLIATPATIGQSWSEAMFVDVFIVAEPAPRSRWMNGYKTKAARHSALIAVSIPS
jgi:hypothetical protein